MEETVIVKDRFLCVGGIRVARLCGDNGDELEFISLRAGRYRGSDRHRSRITLAAFARGLAELQANTPDQDAICD